MIDLHTHTFFSDGELVPSELAHRAFVKGYKVIGITDHADASNMEFLISAVTRHCRKSERYSKIKVLPGIELTHVPPGLIKELVLDARKLGAAFVVVHGETIVEPVAEGTNRAAIEAGVDILAHPGLIREDDVIRAKERGVLLEITSRKGNSLSNGHVARLARQHGAPLVYNTDTHAPSDLTPLHDARRIVLGAGLSAKDFASMQKNALGLVKRALKR
jgi:histidinol phosphatase-like PHP family hydrolase